MDNVVFHHPFTCIIAGPTQCGKTTLVKNILTTRDQLIQPKPDNIIFCYSRFQESYNELSHLPIKFNEGLADLEDELDSRKNNLIILDDLMEQCEKNKSILSLFTVDSHHKNISCIFITQNFYSKGRYMRTLSLNSHYLIIFNNPRDISQIYFLARQMYPNNPNFLIECFEDAVVNKPYGYLFIDLKQSTPKEYRIRTGILLDEEKIVYVAK